MSTKIYVGGLPFSATDEDLTDLFAPYGTIVSARVVTDRSTGQSRGFGFVEMSTPEEARAAIAALAQVEMGGRVLTVSEARPQESRPGGRPGGGGGRPGGGRPGGAGGRGRPRWLEPR